MKIERRNFGKDRHGNDVTLVVLKNSHDTKVHLSTLGAAIVSFIFKDKSGVEKDIILGYDSAEEYASHDACFGACVGRCANRTAGAKVTISGVTYELEKNNGENNIHSGSNSTVSKNWEVENLDESANSVTFRCFSADLEQGFPGNMTAKVTYTLNEEDALSIEYEAVSDKDTVANFTNHSYFNLAGHDGGDIGRQKLKLYADAFTPVRQEDSIPTGEIRAVAGTPLDFTEWKEIGKEIDADYEQLNYTGGYDHNFVLDNQGKLEKMAEAFCEETRIKMTAYTDCPGVQFYAGNFIGNQTGKGGASYADRHGFCLESQYYPDAMNNPAFESPLLKAGELYTSKTVYQLSLA